MTADPILTVAWLALAHLIADFVIQTNRIATEKFGFGRRAWQALGMHWTGAALCLLPFVVAFGLPGFELLVVVSVSHAAIDRAKIVWTMRVARAATEARAERRDNPTPPGLGAAWTPMPAFLFLLDQLAHAVVTVAAWALLLADAPVSDAFGSAVGGLVRGTDQAVLHRVALTTVVLLDLAIINVRAASLFVATLVRPPAAAVDATAASVDQAGSSGDAPAGGTAAGPATGTDAATVMPAAPQQPDLASAATARIGATIGVLERLLIVAFVLANATVAVGFVVAAKTIARFRQLDNRAFAEYYLLGTLASVSVALVSGLIAFAALAVPPVP